MEFKKALEYAKNGKKIRSKSWRNKNCYMFFFEGALCLYCPESHRKIRKRPILQVDYEQDWEIYKEYNSKKEWLSKHGYLGIKAWDNYYTYFKESNHKYIRICYHIFDVGVGTGKREEEISPEIEYLDPTKSLSFLNLDYLNEDLKEAESEYEQMRKDCE